MTRWGMVIDLEKCVGCDTCSAACSQMNHTPAGAGWRQVIPLDTVKLGNPQNGRLFLPINCMHCGDAPCQTVCPTTATFRRADGIVDIHDELCIGCGYCVAACPYLARTITRYDEVYAFAPELLPAASDRSGICTKCNFCLPRVEAGLAQGLTPGVDAAASPNCVNFCIADAIHFGDLRDPSSNVSRLIQAKPTMRLQEDLGADPAIQYVTRPDYPGANGAGVELVPPRKQKVWHKPAAFNFIMGGMGAAVYVLGLWLDWLGAPATEWHKLLAPALIGLGLLGLTLEAGRPFRSIHIFRGWRHSWMSREAWAAAFFLPLAVAAWLWPDSAPDWLAGLAALVFLVSQRFIVYRSRAVAAWNKPIILGIMAAASFAGGAGLFLLAAGLFNQGVISYLAAAGLASVLAQGGLWLVYLRGSGDTAFDLGTAVLRRRRSLLATVGLGIVLPLILLTGILLVEIPSFLLGATAVIGGGAMLLGGAALKGQLILRAGYLRGIRAGD